MPKKIIESSVIKSIEYDGFCSLLTVVLHHKLADKNEQSTYQYANVPRNVYQNFNRCKSKDKFFAEKIVSKYSARKVENKVSIIEDLIREIDSRFKS